MTTPIPVVPHLSVPVALANDGSLTTTQQDSAEEITQCVSMLLGTLPGTRLVVPDYGMPDPTFTRTDPTGLSALVGRWEPRATVQVTTDVTGRTRTVRVAVAGGS